MKDIWRGDGALGRCLIASLLWPTILLGCSSTDQTPADVLMSAPDAAWTSDVTSSKPPDSTPSDAPMDLVKPDSGTIELPAWLAMADRAAYVADLVFIAAPRVPGSAHWQAVQDLCFDRFQQLGYTTVRHDYGTGKNVVGTRSGSVAVAEQILVSAHYDHISSCEGADDNASGVAGLLEIARLLAMNSHDRTLVVICWDEEEQGMIGSQAYVAEAQQRGDQIRYSFVLDMIGYWDDRPDSQQLPEGLELLYPDKVAQFQAKGPCRNNLIAARDDPSRLAALLAMLPPHIPTGMLRGLLARALPGGRLVPLA